MSANAVRKIEALAPMELQSWLEWAGSKLLAIGARSPLPAQIRVIWPDYAPDASVAYGYSGERLRPGRVSSEEIQLMDELLTVPNLITDLLCRRIVNARLLVRPVANTYMYSWSRLAQMLHTDRRRVVRLHYTGLCEASEKLPADKVGMFRQRLAMLSN